MPSQKGKRTSPTGPQHKNSDEQDQAAGGREMRQIKLPDGSTATASISIWKPYKGYQHFAYLRFKSGGKTTQLYVGNVTAETRKVSLARAWVLARAKGLRAGLRWLPIPATRNRSSSGR